MPHTKFVLRFQRPLWVFVSLQFITFPVGAQETSNVKYFGNEGKLYSKGHDNYYLLSRQPYLSEDSAGYNGMIRIEKNYVGGGYEVKILYYIARCNSYDNESFVSLADSGDSDPFESTKINKRNTSPSNKLKPAYNLFWVVCKNIFQKFK